jgi:Ser/Thr protein kinase RdoA (MazF antagonist)
VSLRAVYRVQAELARQGFPAPPCCGRPWGWEHGAVAAMTYLDGERPADPHLPSVRRAMAEALADVLRLAKPYRGTPDLPVSRLPGDQLWPPPHNVLFDLGAPGGEWIDERARAARVVLDPVRQPAILGHTDFSAANVRVRADRVVAVYDVDSMALVDEVRLLASIAVHHTYTGRDGEPCTSPEEARAFVGEYERVRGTPFTRAERDRLDAGAVFALAYTARCEHSLDPTGALLAGSARELLRTVPTRGYFA